MPRFDSKSFGTKLLGHMTLIFSADTRWKAFAAKKTVTPFVESVKNTQRSISDDSGSIYLERGNKEGNALDDWLAAEKELSESAGP